jgi:hypothetical protein
MPTSTKTLKGPPDVRLMHQGLPVLRLQKRLS